MLSGICDLKETASVEATKDDVSVCRIENRLKYVALYSYQYAIHAH